MAALPETPTILQAAGFKYPGMDGGELLEEFEMALFAVQKELEDASTRVALCEQRVKSSPDNPSPVCLLLDRGLLDMRGYMTPALWARILERAGLTEEEVLARYDGVIHLVTAADGAVEHYTCANNVARTETVEEALQNDARVWDAWSIHPKRVRVDNSHGSFARKVAVTCEHAISFVKVNGSEGGAGKGSGELA